MRRSLAFCTLLMTAVGAATAADRETRSAPVAGETVACWIGEHRVQMTLALDEVAVTATPGSALAKDAFPFASGWNGAPAHLRVAPVPDRHALDAARPGIERRGFTSLSAILYDPSARAPTAHILERRLALHLTPGETPEGIASRFPVDLVERLPYGDFVLFSARSASLLSAVDAVDQIMLAGAADSATPLFARLHVAKADPNDPLFVQQWHLKNTGAQVPSAVAGNDINPSAAWNAGFHGEGVNIAIVDIGVATDHPDLAANCARPLHVNFNGAPNGPTDARPNVALGPDAFHGTVVAGLAAASGDNAQGVTGVAYRSGIIGERLVGAPTTDQTDADAMLWRASDADPTTRVHVSNNSWGDPDDGRILAGTGPLIQAAFATGATIGRGGRGIIYTWACGNGAASFDNACYDGFNNSRYTIAVSATNAAGTRESYSEQGCCVLVNAPGGNMPGNGVVSTDGVGTLGFNTRATASGGDYTDPNDLSGGLPLVGTSFSAPIAAGVCALMIQARPSLTWRDVQHILVQSSTKNDPGNAGWSSRGALRPFNHGYGFGRVNASAAVALAQGWTLAPREAAPLTGTGTGAGMAIPDAGPGSTRTLVTSTIPLSGPADFRVEHVEFTVHATHTYRGDLTYRLRSPAGTASIVLDRPGDNNDNLDWTFMSVACWGEHPTGTWSLDIIDNAAGDAGSLTSWSLKAYGYQPYQIPVITGTVPDGIAPGSPDTVLTVTGTGLGLDGGGLGMFTVFWNGTALAAPTVISPTQFQVTIPAGLIGAFGSSGSLTATNPAFLGEGGGTTPSAWSVPIDTAPTISAIANQAVPHDTAVPTLPFTVGDAETAANLLTVTAVSDNPALFPSGNIVLSGSGAARTLALAPSAGGTGAATISVAVSDGARTTITTFVVAVNPPPSDHRCGLGSLFGLLLLACAYRRRQD
ncbi:MAG: S8 family serine peptidase [Planctomycetes bacterium]|nr:S8 family serine peptidase [Planctomycetota bacterium]